VGKGQSSDATCALCHSSADIKVYHRTENVTKHNPTVKPGLVTFTYEIKSATVNSTSNDVSIVFKISSATADANGVLGTAAPITFKAAAAGMANPLTGFSSAPAFLLAYATAQDNITTPIDYNNSGVKQAQALSVSIAGLLDTAKAATLGTIVATAGDPGYYTATLLGSGTNQCASNTVKCVFPVGSKLRTVGLQAYFTQDAGTNGISAATGRHAISAVKAVDTTARRTVVDNDKCANCHEWFEGHGGSRTSNIQICVMCHVPGMPTSGRGISDTVLKPWTWTADENKIVKEWKTTFGFDQSGTNVALKLPVTTNNFKDMIHGIHAGRDRVTPFVDARDRTPSAVTLLDFRRMDFPGKLNNCSTCHVAGTFSNVSASALASTYEAIDAAYAAAITAGTATPALAKTALSTANTTDKVTSPFAASCISCHDSVAAQSHVAKNGGAIMVTRATFATNNVTAGGGEACVTCHGTGKSEDIAVKHAK
jgi:OmcA/MtrC family decaheme c-type cytochrome